MLFILLSVFFVRGDFASVMLHNGVVPVSPTGDASPYDCVINDKAVQYSTAPTAFFTEHGGALAFAIHNKNGRFITVDRESFFNNYLTPEFQHFVLAHECAHHELGHQDKNSAYASAENKKPSEAAADCRAIERLVDLGFKQEQFDVIMGQLGDTSDSMARLVSVKENSRHKNAINRANDAQQCLENYNDRTDR